MKFYTESFQKFQKKQWRDQNQSSLTALLNFELCLGSPVCFLKEDKSLSLGSHLVLINNGMDTGGSRTQPLSRASVLAVGEGGAGIKPFSQRSRVFCQRLGFFWSCFPEHFSSFGFQSQMEEENFECCWKACFPPMSDFGSFQVWQLCQQYLTLRCKTKHQCFICFLATFVCFQ